MTARREILGTEYKQISQTPRGARRFPKNRELAALKANSPPAITAARSTEAYHNKNSQEIAE
jgi:hypothetical protein